MLNFSIVLYTSAQRPEWNYLIFALRGFFEE